MNKYICAVLLLFSTFQYSDILAQDDTQYYPKLKQPIVDYHFTDILNSAKKSASVSDFHGQWLILDFWGASCTGCIASFPETERLHRQFKGKATVMMVGIYHNKIGSNAEETGIKKIYNYHKKLHGLTFPVAFDSLAGKFYNVVGVPQVLVINPKGEVVAKCSGVDSTELAQLMEGKTPNLFYVYSQYEKPLFLSYDFKLPLLTSGTESKGGIDTNFLYRTMFTKYDPNKMTFNYCNGWQDQQNPGTPNQQAEAIGFSIDQLIKIGHFGLEYLKLPDSIYPNVIVETLDKHLFRKYSRNDWYTYSLKYPIGTTAIQRRAMLLEDIKRYFKFVSSIEQREVTVYKLVVTDIKKAQKLKVPGGIKRGRWVDETEKVGINYVDVSLSVLLSDFSASLGNFYQGLEAQTPPIIDATGINYRINMKFEGDRIDLPVVIANLKKYGLDLVESRAVMKCIVVGDSK